MDAKSAVPALTKPNEEAANSIELSIGKVDGSFFDRQATNWADRYESPTYKQRRQIVSEVVLSEVRRLKRPETAIKLLDFGCGSGILLGDAAKLGLHVTGVDRSKAMIDAAHDRLVDLGHQANLEWLQSDSGEGKYAQRVYDIVLCLSVLEFVHDCRSLLFRLSARVSPGGLLVLSVPNRYSWLRSLEKFIHRHPVAFRQFSSLDHLTGADSYLNYQTRQFTRRGLSHLVRCQGLTAESHRFHAAPAWIRRIDFIERVGMMLTMTFRR